LEDWTMSIKLLLLLPLIALGAAGWRMLESRSGAVTETSDEDPPAWVAEPGRYFGEPRDDLRLAVGSAPIHGDIEAARRAATTRARVELLRARGRVTTTSSGDADTSSSAGSGVRRRERVEGTVTGSRLLASWASPEGRMWVLVAEPR
jgi:hypothetical protein